MWSQQVGIIEMILDFFNVHFPDAQIGTDYFKHCLSEVLTYYESTKSCQFDIKEEDAFAAKRIKKSLQKNVPSPAPYPDGLQRKDGADLLPRKATSSDYFPCAFCGEIFATHAAYDEHASLHHSREAGARSNFECDVCGRSFERYLSFKRHRQHHALIKPFVCDMCARAFTRNHDLQRHRANVHRITVAAGTSVRHRARPGPGKIFFCDRCGLTFDCGAELRTHRSTRCRAGPPLPPPNVSFPSESLLSLSLAADCLLGRSLKEESMEEEEEEEELVCEHCEARFRLETDLVEHRILEHTPLGDPASPHGSPASSSDAAGDASCRLPSLPAFPTNPDVAAVVAEAPMEDDKREEEGEEGDVWVCMYCSHRFCNKATLDRHMRTHTGEKPFQCPLCVRRFTRKHDLDRHRSNIHHGVRPFACPHCSKSFPLKKNLAKHLLVSHNIGSPAEVDNGT